MKKIAALVLALVLCLSAVSFAVAESKSVKLGVILLHDEDSTYDLNFINGAKEAAENLKNAGYDVELTLVRNKAETNECYEAAKDLANSGCNIIFADSFGHESFLLQAAKEFPEVQFCHATGTMAHTEKLANFHNAFAAIYEGRFLAGVAAGMKLEEMRENGELKADAPVMGYVGAFTYAEVISGYTSFYLGAKSVCPDVTMKVQFTGSWYDEMAEKSAAEALIAAGCDLISQHADSMGAPTACENAGVPNISYNGSTIDFCPETFIVSSRINWAPYFEYICDAVANGTDIATDWVGTIATGSVQLTEINEDVAAEGTVEVIEALTAVMLSGEATVFNTALEGFITVNGAPLTEYMADVDTDPAYTPDTQVVIDGAFAESVFRSAPYFDVKIDGIELLNAAF